MKILDFEGVKSLITEIKRRIALKQDAEPGKQLSEENFTAEDKEKLESIDLSEYVKFTDYATDNKYGIVKVNIDYGTRIINNTLTIEGASENLVRNETSTRRPLLPTSISLFMDEYGIPTKTTIPDMQEKISKMELKSKTITDTTTASGNLKLNDLNSKKAVIVSVSLKENYIAYSYTDQYNSWYIHVTSPFSGETIGLTEVTVTVYYYEIVSEQNNETASAAEQRIETMEEKSDERTNDLEQTD